MRALLLIAGLGLLSFSSAWADDDLWWLTENTSPVVEPVPLSPALPREGGGSQSALPASPSADKAEETASTPKQEAEQEPESKRTLSITLNGLPEYLHADVLASLTAQRQRKSPFLDDLLVGNLAQRAEREAAEAMQASGFYRAQVTASLQTTEQGWLLTLDFVPGPVVRISEVQVQLLGAAQENTRVANFAKTFPLVLHAPLVHAPYEAFKTRWLQLAQDVGFLDATYTRHEILVNPETDTAQVFLTLESGTRYAFGQTQFAQAGPQMFEERLLHGFLPWQAGEAYRVSRLLELQRTLSDSGYFQQMEVNPKPNRETHTVDVEVSLSTRKQTRYAFGLGYGTDTGARVSAEMDRRFLNARGDRFYGRVALSERDIQVDMELRRPWLEDVNLFGQTFGGVPRTDFYALGLSTRRELLDDVTTNPLALRLSANDTKGDWRRQARLVMLYEKDEINNEPNLYGHMLFAGASLFYRPRVRGRKPMWQWDADVQSTLGSLVSSAALSQFRINTSLNQPVGEADQLLLRGSLGMSWSDDFASVPISLRFFAGGDMSVRGYSFKSLGATDAAGNVVGGENLLVMSAEYQWMFKNPFGMAAFVDSGNAFNGTDISLKTGAGLGALWRSPVGMIGLYLAHGFENEDESFRLHFSLGAEF